MFSSNSHRLRSLLILFLVNGCLQGFVRTSWGAGAESTKRQNDLNVSVDTRWAGCAFGGYYPIRIEATNFGRERAIRFTFKPYGSGLPDVSKTIVLKTNAKLAFSLSIPMTGAQSNGTLDVAINGVTESGLRNSISLPDVDYSSYDRPSLLVISNKTLPLDQYEYGVNWMAQNSAGASSSGGYYGSGGSGRSSDHETIPPTLLPERWIDYSGLDFVAISLDDFDKISSDAREAMLDWCKTGGNLILFDVGALPQQSTRLNELCRLNESAISNSTSWKDAPLWKERVPLVEGDVYSGYTVTNNGNKNQDPFVWDHANLPYQTFDLLDGKLIAFYGNPFPGTRHEWGGLLKNLGDHRIRWTYRNGITSRSGHDEFLHFMVPGISGVPVVAFLLLITVFSVVIGPVNYFYLNRKKRLYLLIITIPVIALVTSLSLFSYSLVAHGFSTKSRIRSLVTVDQQAAESVIDTRVSFYSGLAPSEGLQFQADTAVFPIWPEQDDDGLSSGLVDWTNQQSLRTGWLKSRTRTQFKTVSVRDERGRLTLSPPSGGSMDVANGFEYDLEQLLVRGTDGKLYYGTDIRADTKKTLKLASTEQISSVSNVIRENQPALPDNYDPNTSSYSSRYRSGRYPGGNQLHTQFSNSLSERSISSLVNSFERELGDRQYFGIFSENPEVPIGVNRTSERSSLFLLHGYY
ncbi:MAG: hypothetical protein HUJ26_11145 [Planctomycetaceae bacterium]|nr:hypothetical protein [Planctomycetaceae bacterium]